MSKHIKLPHLDYSGILRAAKAAVRFGCKYKTQICGGAACVLFFDDIRGRIGRKKDRIEYEKNNLKHQAIERKHEAEIRACKDEARQYQELPKKVAVLEQIVENITADRGDSE